MADNVTIGIKVTAGEYARIVALGQQRGYAMPADYMRGLIETEVDEIDEKWSQRATRVYDHLAAMYLEPEAVY
jgi:hypothetical protein